MLVRLLLDGGASATMATKQGRTPLHYAHHQQTFRWLVDAKV
jgi:ankyrin repeat protein